MGGLGVGGWWGGGETATLTSLSFWSLGFRVEVLGLRF